MAGFLSVQGISGSMAVVGQDDQCARRIRLASGNQENDNNVKVARLGLRPKTQDVKIQDEKIWPNDSNYGFSRIPR